MRLGTDERAIPRTLAALTLGAIVVRILMFFGRGDYIAFDEGWYLLLGQSLWAGEGYRLTGLRHTTLSPLFPLLAGALGRLLGDPVWAGRIVAAVTSGLLVLPCWFIFRRIAGRRTALLGCVIVAVMPSLAPFVAPEWVGWDLWVGAEPVYHLFLYTGIALVLHAVERRRSSAWLASGVALALAYLARPEAVVLTALIALAVVGAAALRRDPRLLAGCVWTGLAFVAISAPYWVYLRNVTGHWTLTGRAVQLRSAERTGPSATRVIEGMLWEGRQGTYVRNLFSLDPTGTRMASSYWGIPEDPPVQEAGPEARVVPGEGGAEASISSAAGEDSATTGDPMHSLATKAATETDPTSADSAGPTHTAAPGPKRPALYVQAFGKLVPELVWPFFLVGVLAPRRPFRAVEPLVVTPLLLTSLLVAGFVAIDPRTQLFMVPAVGLYAARGARWLGIQCDALAGKLDVRRGLIPGLLALVVVGSLVIEDARRLYMSRVMDTTHQILAAENRRAGIALRGVVPDGKALMSWHPAVAIHARREWRVLPMAPLPQILRYAGAIGADYIVFCDFYPSPIPAEAAPGAYLVVPVEPGAAAATGWWIRVKEVRDNVAVGELVPSST